MKPGDVLDGRFVLERVAASGGMGVVYRALDRATSGLAAVKVMRVSGDDAAPRFEREAATLAALRHPAIVEYLGHGGVDDELYLAMEWLDGEDLASRLAAADLGVPESILVVSQIAAAIAVAHERGIVHRDIKPSNIFLVEWSLDRVKLLDFGIARRAGLSPLTASGLLVGTLQYMSPEQARGSRDIDARADVYALGTLLFRCLTGRAPFGGASPAEVLAAIVSQTAPRVRSLAPAVPRDLDDLVAAMLDKGPARRPGDGAAVHAALIGLGATRALPAPDAAASQVRFCHAGDGTRLAYATVGTGPPLVKVASWMSHLEHEWDSPVSRHFMAELARDHLLVRYDARGCGLSERDAPDVSFESFVTDLETVVDAVGLERFALLGQSQGAAVALAYAVRHPERVTRLVLLGGFARGWRKRSAESAASGEAMTVLVRQGWGAENPAYRQLFTSQFIPDAGPEQMRWFNELARVATSPETAARILEALGTVDVTSCLPSVATPTLVLHSRHDGRCPYDEGLRMASSIPGARFVTLDSKNHIILEEEPAWRQLVSELRRFLGEQR